MSPAKKKPASTVLPVALPALAPMLDLPAGTEVAGVEVKGDILLLTLTGTDCAQDRTDAEYSVDAHGRRTFTRFKPPNGDASGITPDPDPTEEKE